AAGGGPAVAGGLVHTHTGDEAARRWAHGWSPRGVRAGVMRSKTPSTVERRSPKLISAARGPAEMRYAPGAKRADRSATMALRRRLNWLRTTAVPTLRPTL